MPRPFKPSILTANHLITGEVVYYDLRGHWASSFEAARVFTAEEEAQAAFLSTNPSEVVGAYLVSVAINGDTYQPDHFREDFRANGPSNYFHGKQAQRNQAQRNQVQRKQANVYL